jgi:hypothetical protein
LPAAHMVIASGARASKVLILRTLARLYSEDTLLEG